MKLDDGSSPSAATEITAPRARRPGLRRRRKWPHYVLALTTTALAFLLYLRLSSMLHNHLIPIVFLIPVVISAYVGGLGPGLACTLLGVISAIYFLAVPGDFKIVQPVEYMLVVTLLFVGVLISVLFESLHRANQRVAREIVQHQLSDEHLIESERRYRSLFENMLVGLAYCKMLFDQRGRPTDFIYLEVNPAFELLTGLKNVIGKKATQVIPGIRELHPELMEIYGRVASTGRPERFEINFKPLNSWFSISTYSPQKNYLVIVFDNITSRKKAEQSIKDDEEELAAIYDNVPLIMLLLDGDRRICKANKFASQFAGLSSADFAGLRTGQALRCLHALDDPRGCGFGPDCPKCAVRVAALDTLVTGRSHQQVEATLSLTTAAESQDLAVLLSTTRIEVGGQPRVLVTMQDITERKRAEDQLRRQLSLMNCITDKSTDSIFLTDREGRVTFLNPEAQRVFGFTPEEMIGHSLHDLIHHHYPDGRPFPASECPVLKTLQTQDTLRDHEEVYFRKDGTMIEISGSTALLDAGGQQLGLVYVLHDITERKHAARAKLRSQKLEALGTIAGGIAHDFNNILAAINGNANLALCDPALGRSASECLTEISKAGARASDLVRRILSFSRPFEQKREIQPLQHVVEEALKLVRATLPALIEIHIDFPPGLPSVNVDSTQIHQVIVNLATNSAHAIGDKPGRIDVRLDCVFVEDDHSPASTKLREGRYVRLYVSDNGCGIPPATIERIFDPFFTTKPPGVGTGLGLSVVHGIVCNHDGAITVSSEPGNGTAFHLYFPAVEPALELPSPAPQQNQATHSEHVLYVDDEEALVFLGTRNLERLGYKVSGFTEAESALHQFRLQPASFDAVITDVSMPHMSGFELARQLLAVRSDIPILVTSGYVRPEDQQKAEQLGIRDLLLKPTALDDLARALDRILPSRAAAAGSSSP